MITLVSGTIEDIRGYILELTIGDFGLSIYSPNAEQYERGQKIRLYTLLHWSAEGGPTLFGFEQRAARCLFQLVIQCQGVGPKLALSLIARLGSSGFISALMERCAKTIATVPGIGIKRAEQVILSVLPKVEKLLASGQLQHGGASSKALQTVSAALRALSYGRDEIRDALLYVGSEAQGDDIPTLTKKALSFLAIRKNTSE